MKRFQFHLISVSLLPAHPRLKMISMERMSMLDCGRCNATVLISSSLLLCQGLVKSSAYRIQDTEYFSDDDSKNRAVFLERASSRFRPRVHVPPSRDARDVIGNWEQ